MSRAAAAAAEGRSPSCKASHMMQPRHMAGFLTPKSVKKLLHSPISCGMILKYLCAAFAEFIIQASLRFTFERNGITMVTALSIIFAIACVILILAILFQSGKSAGLTGALTGGSDTFLSKNKARSFDARLAKATKWIAIAFMILALALTIAL